MVVAVSGGPDSVALFRALLELRQQGDGGFIGSLVIAHLNHQLRGAESDDDERFIWEFCEALQKQGIANLQFRSERVNIAAQALEQRDNLESVARSVRYEWLQRIAREAGIALVATGHTADDQAETVLHRLLRGTGLRGLRGIPERRQLTGGVEVIRPLLKIFRYEVLAYLADLGQPYRQDSSNLCLNYTRNRIRHELLPALANSYNPAIVSILNRLAEQAADVYQDLEARAHALLAEIERPRAGAVLVFDRQSLAVVPRHLLREVFRRAWEREAWPMSAMGFREWDWLVEVGCAERVAIDLPGGIHARRKGSMLLLGP
jgi:tRNA(Ile)-lysidine synthase